MKVIVIYGSPNDKPFMEPAREYFAQENVPYEETVLSAHRDLPELIRFLGDLEASGEKAVILAVAGLSAALPGVVVMSCSLPAVTTVNSSMIRLGTVTENSSNARLSACRSPEAP